MRRTVLSLLPALVLGALLAGLARAEDEPAPAPPQAEEAGDGVDPEQAALAAMLVELRKEAAEIRGLPWKREVPGHHILKKDIPPAFAQEVEYYVPRAKRERYARALRRLGLLGEQEDPFALMGEMMASSALGFYSPRAKELFVVEGNVGDAARPILLHELVHALEDQHFDFQTRSLPIGMDPDRSFAETCVIEGSAEYARVAYQKAHPEIMAAFRRSQADPSKARDQMRMMQRVPAWMIVPTLLHYRLGPVLVGRALRESESKDYPQVMATLFADPPESTEQVLHPDRFFTAQRDYPRGIVWAGDLGEALGRGWTRIYEQRFGELDLALYLDRWIGGTNGRVNVREFVHPVPVCAEARRAAAGWDGGRMVFFAKGDEPLVMLQAWCFDTPEDAQEAGAAVVTCLRKQHGDAWQAKDWRASAPALGRPHATSTLSYQGRFGPGRIAILHDRVVVLDGAPEASFEAAWHWARATRFLKDDRDTWTPEPAEAR